MNSNSHKDHNLRRFNGCFYADPNANLIAMNMIEIQFDAEKKGRIAENDILDRFYGFRVAKACALAKNRVIVISRVQCVSLSICIVITEC